MPTWKRAPLVLSLLLLPACSGGVALNSLTATSPRPGANDHSPAFSANATHASPPANDASFTCATQTSGGTPGLLAQLTDVRMATHPGYDRITFQFARPAAPPSSSLAAPEVPSFSLTSQASANFARGDGLGGRQTIDGVAGIRIVFIGSSGWDNTANSAPRTYTGSVDIKANLPILKEAAELGDFERVLVWGAGLSSSPCLRLTELANPSRLAIDVRSAT